MQAYLNRNGNSNVKCYEIGNTYIDVSFFGTPKTNRYSNASAGRNQVEQMKILARNGSGLNSYIMNNVRFAYEK